MGWCWFWQKVSDNLYPCNCKNDLVLKGGSHFNSSSIDLLAAIGLLAPLSWYEYWQRSALAAFDAYPEIKDIFVAFTENHLLFSLDSLDMAGAVHGLRQMSITKYTTQTRETYFGFLDEHCIRQDIFGERFLKGSKIYNISEWVRVVHCCNTAINSQTA